MTKRTEAAVMGLSLAVALALIGLLALSASSGPVVNQDPASGPTPVEAPFDAFALNHSWWTARWLRPFTLTAASPSAAAVSPVTLSRAAALANAGNPSPSGVPGRWTLAEGDEFNRTRLDTRIWQPGWFGSGVTGPADQSEQACYSSNNVTFPGDGAVHLRLTSTPARCSGRIEPYTGAVLSSNPADGRASGGYQYTYGALEARVYIPASSNGQVANWPAVWTDGQTWPAGGEDDVFEGLGGHACFNFHYPSGGPGVCVSGVYTGWHTFGSDWEPGSVTYYYDGVQVGKVTTGITSAPMYLVLTNTSSGATRGPTVTPADMRVDYVRVWKH